MPREFLASRIARAYTKFYQRFVYVFGGKFLAEREITVEGPCNESVDLKNT